MYVNPKQKKRVLLSTLIVALSIPLTVAAAYLVTQIISNASGEAIPKDVIVSNITSSALTVSWITDIDADATIEYTPVPAAGQVSTSTTGKKATDTRGVSRRKTHYVDISGLESETTYQFVIYSNNEKYTAEGGAQFQFKTAPSLGSVPVPNPVYGKATGVSSDDAIAYIVAFEDPNTCTGTVPCTMDFKIATKYTFPVSGLIRSGGNWQLQLSSLMNAKDYTEFTIDAKTKVTILVQSAGGYGLSYTRNYNDLFDSSGRVKDGITMEIKSETSIISFVPDTSKFVTILAEDPCSGKTCGCGTLPACVDPCAGKTCGCGTLPACVDPCAGKTCGCGTLPTCQVTDPCEGKTCGCGTLPTCPVTDPCEGKTCGCGTLPACPIVREYKIAQDVQWGALVLGTSTVNLPNIPLDRASIKITNTTDTGFNVVWISSQKETGSIKLGTSATDLATEYKDVRDTVLNRGTYNVHNVEVTKLTPGTQYYYKILSGSATYTNSGSPYEYKTFDTLASPPPYKTVSGKVENYANSADSVVVIQLQDKDSTGTSGNSTYVSTMPDTTGNWIASIGDARNAGGTEYFVTSDDDSLVATLAGFVEPVPLTNTTKDIEDASLVLTVKASSVTEPVPGKVLPLSDYGVYKSLSEAGAASGSAALGTGGAVPSETGGTEQLVQGGSVPNTALSPLGLIIIAGWVGVFSLGVLILTKKKKRNKVSKMSDHF